MSYNYSSYKFIYLIIIKGLSLWISAVVDRFFSNFCFDFETNFVGIESLNFENMRLMIRRSFLRILCLYFVINKNVHHFAINSEASSVSDDIIYLADNNFAVNL